MPNAVNPELFHPGAKDSGLRSRLGLNGGPVIGSGLVVSKDPDTGQRNVSFHRLQVKGPNKTGILLYPRHTWKNYLKYQERNEPMPVAMK